MILKKFFFHLILFIHVFISVGLCTEKTDKDELSSEKKLRNYLEPSLILSDVTNRQISESSTLWKQPLTGVSSYPKEIEEIYEAYGGIYSYGAWILTTRNTMRKLAHSSSIGDPISTLYLAHAFNQTCYVSEDICPLTAQLYEKAFQDLDKIASQPNHPYFNKANCLLAMEHDSSVFIGYSKKIPYKGDTGLIYLKNIKNKEASLLKKIINIKHNLIKDDIAERLLIEENLKCYPGIFLKIVNLLNLKIPSKISILEKSVKIFEHPAFFMALADSYKRYFEWTNSASYKEKAINMFEKAGELGCPAAYMEMTAFIAPYEIVGNFFDFTGVESLEDLNKCKEYLEKAVRLEFPAAFYNLAFVTREYSIKEEDKEKLAESMLKLWKQAAQYGFWNVYNFLEDFIDEGDNFLAVYPSLEIEKEKLFKQAMNKM